MNINEFKTALETAPDKNVRFVLPDGVGIPPHFHICEIAQVERKYIDCCGEKRSESAVTLQAIAGKRPYDETQSMAAAKLVKILGSASGLISDRDVAVEIEFGEPNLSRFPITSLEQTTNDLVFQLQEKNGECLTKQECEAEPEAPCYCHVAGCC